MYINHIYMITTMAHTPFCWWRSGCPGDLADGQVVSALVSRRAMAMDYVDGEALSKASERLTQDGFVAHVLRRKNWDKNGDFRGNSWDL